MIPKQIIFLSLGVLAFVLALIGNLIYTHRELLKKSTLSHWHDWKIKAASGLPAVLMFSLASVKISFVYRLSLSSILVGFWFLVLFDGFYGLAVANDFFFTGTATGKDAALSDRFLRFIGKPLHILLKGALCGGILYVYIKLL